MTTKPPVARLAFITEPSPGVFMLTQEFAPGAERVIGVKNDGTRVEQNEITEAQLSQMLIAGASMAAGKSK